MVRRAIAVMGWGGAGFVVSLSLVLGAFRIAESRLSDPASPIRLSMPPLISHSPSPAPVSPSTSPALTASSGPPSPAPVRAADGGEHGGSGEPSHTAESADHGGDD
jgi:hypothetical protein